ncbi:MAG: hypothetical protein JO301_06455, partial [Chitinophagaceae bacterium]|nr:hypothetical protein [Chitinophagaceae bacterium]
ALFALVSPASLELKITHAPVIMPAVYKVYANENALGGKYSLFKMLVTNNSNNAAHNVEVQYEIPNYVEWKTVQKIPNLLPGESVVVNCYPSFPEKIVEKTTSSREKVNIKVKGTNIDDIENQFSIDIKGRNEFLYSGIPSDEIRTGAERLDNMSLLSCYITPEDPIIKYFTQQLQEKVLRGEAASVTRKDEEGVRFMTAIYAASAASHMVYSGTSGVPANVGDVSSILQSIRLPREVLTGKTGLCIELSLFYASVMAAAGMDPVVFLIPGHAYPGFRMNGHYYAIEATGINGEGLGGVLSADQALQIGMKSINEFNQHAMAGDDRYMLLDVRDAIQKGAEAMELKDDSYLRKKIDDMAAEWMHGGARAADPETTTARTSNRQPAPAPSPRRNEDNDSGGNNTGLPAGYNLFEGIVTFAYPSSWNFKQIPQGLMQAFKHDIVSGDQQASVEVYDFSSYGYGSPADGPAAIKQTLSQYGANYTYQVSGQLNGYTLYAGHVIFSNGTRSNIVAAFKNGGRGVVGMLVAASDNSNSVYRNTMINILNSIK